MHKIYHIYDNNNQRLTLHTVNQQGNNLALFHIYDDNRKLLMLDKVLKGSDKEIWNRSSSNKFGHLAQGNKYGVKYRDVMEFIKQSEVPADKKVTLFWITYH